MSHVNKTRIYLHIAILMLVSLACGVQGQKLKVYQSMPTETAEATEVEMMVTGDLYIRTAAGEKSPLIDGKNTLHEGDFVTCSEFVTFGDGLWCKHEKGWSNARWMVGYNKVKGE